VCRVIQRLRPLLALEPVSRPADAADRLWIVDGTLIPVRDRQVGASSRNYRFSANVQVIIDADTRLVVATGQPAPGNGSVAKVSRRRSGSLTLSMVPSLRKVHPWNGQVRLRGSRSCGPSRPSISATLCELR
jgi:hypothetical protein